MYLLCAMVFSQLLEHFAFRGDNGFNPVVPTTKPLSFNACIKCKICTRIANNNGGSYATRNGFVTHGE